MAKKKPIDTLTPDDLGVNAGESLVRVNSHSSPPEKQAGQKFVGADSVPQVVSKLREEANVI